jgi:hypothetical protein
MSFNFSGNGYISKNGEQSSLRSKHAIHSSVKRGSIFNHQASPQRMEVKLLATVLTWVGLTSYFLGIFMNIGTWKGDILFLCGCAFMLLKFIRLVIRTWYDAKKEEIELKILKKKSGE